VKIQILLWIALASAITSAWAAPQRQRPNIVFLMSDDHWADAMSCMGNPVIETPNIGRLAQRGVLLDRCYATSPLCMASRATVMLGMYEYMSWLIAVSVVTSTSMTKAAPLEGGQPKAGSVEKRRATDNTLDRRVDYQQVLGPHDFVFGEAPSSYADCA
jgi:hypothetical protein